MEKDTEATPPQAEETSMEKKPSRLQTLAKEYGTAIVVGALVFVVGLGIMLGTMLGGELSVPDSNDKLFAQQVTNSAIKQGKWSDASTWQNGDIPSSDSVVYIPKGVEITIDSELADSYEAVYVDGILSFATDVNTELKVDTLVTGHDAQFTIGDKDNPVQENVTAKVTIANDGPISLETDPQLISRGAIFRGMTKMYGSEKLAFAVATTQPKTGDTSVTLDKAPAGWKAGDSIVIAGTDHADPLSDEKRTIASIDGNTITFDQPLEKDHTAPLADLEVHIANLTRNIQFSSESTEPLERGHVMFMHNNNADLNYVSFTDMGRTDKSMELNDHTFVSDTEGSIGAENTQIEKLNGTNVRGRYSVHFHRGGADKNGPQAQVNGTVVENDPGWAYLNHSSNVNFTNNVSYNITGAAYNTEAGDEIGAFIGNIALRTYNAKGNLNSTFVEEDPEQAPDARAGLQDYGWQGDGFWLHGAGVDMKDNVVSGASGHAYIYWTLGLVEDGIGEAMVDVANVPNGELIGEPGTKIRTKQVPVPSFENNDGYATVKGLQVHYLHTDHRDDGDKQFEEEGLLVPVPQEYEDTLQSTFKDSTFWNQKISAVDLPYSTRFTLDNITAIGSGEAGTVGVRLDHFANENDITIKNSRIEGFELGLTAPRQGQGLVENVELANSVDLFINAPERFNRDMTIRNISFEAIPDRYGDVPRQNIALAGGEDPLEGLLAQAADAELLNFDEILEESSVNTDEILQDPDGDGIKGVLPGILTLKDRIVWERPGQPAVGIFFEQQRASFVPIPAGSGLASIVDPKLVGLTNSQLFDQYGYAFGGFAAPSAAETSAQILNGLLGTPTPTLPADTVYGGLYQNDFYEFIEPLFESEDDEDEGDEEGEEVDPEDEDVEEDE